MLNLVNKPENHVELCTKLQIIRKIGHVASPSDASNLICFGGNIPQWARASSFTSFLDHTQRRTRVGRTPLYE